MNKSSEHVTRNFRGHLEDSENSVIEKALRQIRSTQMLLDNRQKKQFGRGRLPALVKDAIFFRGDLHLIDQFRRQLITIRPT